MLMFVKNCTIAFNKTKFSLVALVKCIHNRTTFEYVDSICMFRFGCQ